MAAVFAALPLVGPAFTMYASSVEFRVAIVGRTANGGRFTVPPISLAHAFPPSGRALLMGTEVFRRSTDVAVLRRHLDDVAKVACREHPGFAEFDVALTERTAKGVVESKGQATCAP
ncbi:hypothetical protein AKJ09_06681 [Labilithrix luteola]|uniref:Uncharacterized protein n=1 Tax=Labilithrix luteola TaxID=1391654 RepID=A0A0K1Q2R0_9BACT|nr:hypothetical protein [Labilithrix luteola]AKV00018.1 hypothetical protein AKJ09_06681 [Labilithrix luteola]